MQRQDALTGMRGVAALLVVGFHAILVFYLAQVLVQLAGGLPGGADAFRHPWSAWLLGGGWIGVDFFFVLSGFLLGRPLLRAARPWSGWPAYRVFAAKRLLRIAPPYYASLVLGFLLVGWTGNFAYRVSWEGLLVHLAYLHGFFAEHQFAINGVYWTLGIELQFYLLLPLLALPFRGRRWPLAAAAAFLLTLAYILWAHDPADAARTRFLTFQFPAFLGHFAAGLAAARGLDRDRPWRLPPDAVALAAIALLLVLPAVALGYTRQFEPVTHDAALAHAYQLLLRPAAAAAFGILIVCALQPGSLLGRLLSTRPLVAAGEASYSLYLVHLPLAGILFVHDPAWLVTLGVPTFTVCVYVAALALAGAFYWLVERPSLRLKDHVVGRLEAPHA